MASTPGSRTRRQMRLGPAMGLFLEQWRYSVSVTRCCQLFGYYNLPVPKVSNFFKAAENPV